MNGSALYGELLRRGVHLALDGDQIRYRAPAGSIDEALRREMASRKHELMAVLREQADRLRSATKNVEPPEERCRWISCPRPDPGARLRLFCLPPAGGGTLLFRGWPGRLPDAEVCLVQLPGREARRHEPPFTHWEPLVEALADGLEPWLDRPFALFGHSMGALLGFELARRLRRRGRREPEALIASGRNAPSRPWELPALSRLSDDALALWLRRLGGTPAEVLADPDLRNAILPVVRADMAVCESYVHEPAAPLPCAILALGGLQDPHTDPQGLEGWRREAGGGFAVRCFAGDHFFLRAAEDEVLGALAHELAQAAAPAGPERGREKEPSTCPSTRRFTFATWKAIPSPAGGAS